MIYAAYGGATLLTCLGIYQGWLITLHRTVSDASICTILVLALAPGARLVKPAGKTFWGGYSGYFQDPDGHLWEIVFNPDFVPEK